MAHTPIGECTSDCRRIGCPEEDLCVQCGENKWQNREKHLQEIIMFMKEKIEECQELISTINTHGKRT